MLSQPASIFPKVSIIVPFFNAENFLEECLISIQNQTFENFEVILVNDESTDNSLRIAQKFLNDKRFSLYSQKHSGLAISRQLGFEKSNGVFLAFVDADDKIHAKYLELLLNSITETRSDISVCGVFYWYYLSSRATYNTGIVANTTTDAIGFAKLTLSLKETKSTGIQGGFAWNKLYKRNLFSKESFIDTKGAEDELMQFSIVNNVRSVSYITLPLYYYRRGAPSLSTNSKWRLNHIRSRRQLVDMTNSNFKAIAIAGFAIQIASTIEHIIKGNEKDQETISAIRDELKHLDTLVTSWNIDLTTLCDPDSLKYLKRGSDLDRGKNARVSLLQSCKNRIKRLIGRS